MLRAASLRRTDEEFRRIAQRSRSVAASWRMQSGPARWPRTTHLRVIVGLGKPQDGLSRLRPFQFTHPSPPSGCTGDCCRHRPLDQLRSGPKLSMRVPRGSKSAADEGNSDAGAARHRARHGKYDDGSTHTHSQTRYAQPVMTAAMRRRLCRTGRPSIHDARPWRMRPTILLTGPIFQLPVPGSRHRGARSCP